MLKLHIPASEFFDEASGEFVSVKEQTIVLEHSLVSLSKWESKWHVPYFSKQIKTMEETLDYIKCMTITQNVNPNVYKALSSEMFKKINDYINDPMSAAWFPEDRASNKTGEQVTSESIYYGMIVNNIPFKCEKWHLNRLMTLIRFCNAKNNKPKKMSQREIIERNRALNMARRKKFRSRG